MLLKLIQSFFSPYEIYWRINTTCVSNDSCMLFCVRVLNIALESWEKVEELLGSNWHYLGVNAFCPPVLSTGNSDSR